MELASNRNKCTLGCKLAECKLKTLGIITGVAAELIPEGDIRTLDALAAHENLIDLCRNYSEHEEIITIEENL